MDLGTDLQLLGQARVEHPKVVSRHANLETFLPQPLEVVLLVAFDRTALYVARQAALERNPVLLGKLQILTPDERPVADAVRAELEHLPNLAVVVKLAAV